MYRPASHRQKPNDIIILLIWCDRAITHRCRFQYIVRIHTCMIIQLLFGQPIGHQIAIAGAKLRRHFFGSSTNKSAQSMFEFGRSVWVLGKIIYVHHPTALRWWCWLWRLLMLLSRAYFLTVIVMTSLRRTRCIAGARALVLREFLGGYVGMVALLWTGCKMTPVLQWASLLLANRSIYSPSWIR